MHYKITRQYTRDMSVFFAQFNDLKAAKLFILTKINDDNAVNYKVTYRIYHDDEIIYEPNKLESSTTAKTPALYKNFKYQVKQNITKTNLQPIAEFDDLADAKKFIEAKLQKDDSTNLDVKYQIFEQGQFHSEYSKATTKESSQSGNKNTLAFRPTPLPLAPTLGPRSFLKNNTDDKEDLDEKDK